LEYLHPEEQENGMHLWITPKKADTAVCSLTLLADVGHLMQSKVK